MTRPNPASISRRPMARGRRVAVANSSVDGASGPLFGAHGQLNLDQLHRLTLCAQSIVEGCEYTEGVGGQETFLGTVVLDIQLESTENVAKLARVMLTDTRAQRAIKDRIYREVARVLESRLPEILQIELRSRSEGARIMFSADIEAPLGVAGIAVG